MSDYLANPIESTDQFRNARRRATIETLFSRLSNRRSEALSYGEIIQRLHGRELPGRKLRAIPLDKVVGSVGRYQDFTQSFLPKQNSDLSRWVNVHQLATGSTGFPPIEVYQVGEFYFVKDGNHRVSVARQMGMEDIEGYVTEVITQEPFDLNDSPDDLILKSERIQFLSDTQLATQRPDEHFYLTEPGNYRRLLDHIEVHRYFMGIDFNESFSLQKAAAHWYDKVYTPIEQLIERHNVLRLFPKRTPVDLYIWLARHRAKFQDELGWAIDDEKLLDTLLNHPDLWMHDSTVTLSEANSSESRDVAADAKPEIAGIKAIQVVICDWALRWTALEQAATVAQSTGATIYAMWITETEWDNEAPYLAGLREEFDQRCQALGVNAQVAFVSGNPIMLIRQRSAWADLVVIHPSTLARRGHDFQLLRSRLRSLIRYSEVPILACADQASDFKHVLMKVDGNARTEAALCLTAELYPQAFQSLYLQSMESGEKRQKSSLEHALNILPLHESKKPITLSPDAPLPEHTDLYVMPGYLLSSWRHIQWFRDRLDDIFWEQKIAVLVIN